MMRMLAIAAMLIASPLSADDRNWREVWSLVTTDHGITYLSQRPWSLQHGRQKVYKNYWHLELYCTPNTPIKIRLVNHDVTFLSVAGAAPRNLFQMEAALHEVSDWNPFRPTARELERFKHWWKTDTEALQYTLANQEPELFLQDVFDGQNSGMFFIDAGFRKFWYVSAHNRIAIRELRKRCEIEG